MARKTFISYKYSESKGLREKIIDALGDDATYYKGEHNDSRDLSDESNDYIKRYLKDMIFDTSVTILILSPHMRESIWIDWEVEYSLRNYSRDEKTSKTNGVVAVALKVNGDYGWLFNLARKSDGCSVRTYNNESLYDIIRENRFNRIEKKYHCDDCKSYDLLEDSYISIATEDAFLKDPNAFIENAFSKSKIEDQFNLCKTR